jgi:predicted NUDIX family NTP pyrophosphohydrolase
VFLVHPGGPCWKEKDAGAWSIPKGEYEEAEDPLKRQKENSRKKPEIKRMENS